MQGERPPHLGQDKLKTATNAQALVAENILKSIRLYAKIDEYKAVKLRASAGVTWF